MRKLWYWKLRFLESIWLTLAFILDWLKEFCTFFFAHFLDLDTAFLNYRLFFLIVLWLFCHTIPVFSLLPLHFFFWVDNLARKCRLFSRLGCINRLSCDDTFSRYSLDLAFFERFSRHSIIWRLINQFENLLFFFIVSLFDYFYRWAPIRWSSNLFNLETSKHISWLSNLAITSDTSTSPFLRILTV